MDTREPNFRNFIATFRGHMLEAMSGSFSVPFTCVGVALAFFSKESNAALCGAILFLTLGVGALWFAAYRIWAAERHNLITLDISTQAESVRTKLGDLRHRGVDLRNEVGGGFFFDQGLVEWVQKIADWNAEVIETIALVSPADAKWFSILDTVPPPRIPLDDFIKTDDQEHFYRMHDFRLVKLNELITGERGNLVVRR